MSSKKRNEQIKSVLEMLKQSGAPAPGEWDVDTEAGTQKKKKKDRLEDEDMKIKKARKPIQITGVN
jgi:hypothetical protein